MSSKDTDDSSFGFDRGRVKRQRELTNNKTKKSKFLSCDNYVEDLFGFA